MQTKLTIETAIDILRDVTVAMVRRDGPVLTSHQFGVFLTCYLSDGDHTVRGLAKTLGVSKSVITRSLDKLTDLGLARRKPDPVDRRSVLVERTSHGQEMLLELYVIAGQVMKNGHSHPH